MALTILWPIIFFVFALIRCQNDQTQRTDYIENTCATSDVYFVPSAISSVLIDLAILIIPMPPIWKLQLKTGRKIGIAGTFILGYSWVFLRSSSGFPSNESV